MDGETKMRKSRFFPGLLLGLIVGALGAAVAPSWWQSIVPDALFPQGTIEGLVLGKDRESGRLLVKIETREGVLLATFTERQDATDLLVEVGDTATLRVSRYEPFLTDPRLARVRKPEASKAPEAPSREDATPSPSGAPERSAPAAPSESTTTTTTTTPSSSRD
jgi:hypothetical protein